MTLYFLCCEVITMLSGSLYSLALYRTELVPDITQDTVGTHQRGLEYGWCPLLIILNNNL